MHCCFLISKHLSELVSSASSETNIAGVILHYFVLFMTVFFCFSFFCFSLVFRVYVLFSVLFFVHCCLYSLCSCSTSMLLVGHRNSIRTVKILLQQYNEFLLLRHRLTGSYSRIVRWLNRSLQAQFGLRGCKNRAQSVS